MCVLHECMPTLKVLFIWLQLYYREPWTLLPLVLPVIISVLWAGALYFFLRNVSSWQVRNLPLFYTIVEMEVAWHQYTQRYRSTLESGSACVFTIVLTYSSLCERPNDRQLSV